MLNDNLFNNAIGQKFYIGKQQTESMEVDWNCHTCVYLFIKKIDN